MFSLFILLVLIRIANKYLDKDADKLAAFAKPGSGSTIQNYFPFVFHFLIVILILVSCFMPSVLNKDRIHILVSDGIFQFVSTLLIFVISIINPFIPISQTIKDKIQRDSADKNLEWLKWFTEGYNWQWTKALACILIVAYFIHSGYLVIPDLKQGVLSGIAIILIFFFLFGNIVQLIKNPTLFKNRTLFRLSMLYRSFKLSFFISIVLIIVILITSVILKLPTEKHVNIEGVILLVYNVVMAYNEFKIINDTSLTPLSQ